MPFDARLVRRSGLSKQIAETIKTAIVNGAIVVGERLPSETALAEHYGVSRPTVREALKHLAAQRLIRTSRGATGGAFVNLITWEDAHDDFAATSGLLISMHKLDFKTITDARFALEKTCVRFACQRGRRDAVRRMQDIIADQAEPGISLPDFCMFDLSFHRELVAAAGNPMLSCQVAGTLSCHVPLLASLNLSAADRGRIIAHNRTIAAALETSDADRAESLLDDLADTIADLFSHRRAEAMA